MMKWILSLFLACMISLPLAAAEPVDINTATAEEIANALTGVGVSKAALIVEYREQNGPFTHMDELVNVKGIGLRTLDKNRDMIVLSGASADAE
jgi:competence protein ComEA